MCISAFRPCSSPSNSFVMLFIYMAFSLCFLVAIFYSEIVRFLLHPVVGMFLCHLLRLVSRIFFRCFIMFYFVCLVLSFVKISLIFLLSPGLPGLFPRVLLLFVQVLPFPFCLYLMVFHWSLSDCKSPQVSRTRLSILAVLSTADVWIVSTRPPTSKFSRLFNNPLVIVPNAPITIGTIVTLMFHSFFDFLSMSMYLSFFSLSFRFILWSTGTAKSTILQIFFFCWLLLLLLLLLLLYDQSPDNNVRTKRLFSKQI